MFACSEERERELKVRIAVHIVQRHATTHEVFRMKSNRRRASVKSLNKDALIHFLMPILESIREY